MQRPWHTLILLPHGRPGSRELRFTTRQILGFGLAVALLAGSAGWGLWTLARHGHAGPDLQRMRAENDALRGVNSSFESTLQELQARVAEYESRTRELAIVAGIEGRAGAPGAGGEELADPAAPSALSLPGLSRRASVLDRALDDVEQSLNRQLRWTAAAPTLMPTQGVFTSAYGYRKDPFHGRTAYHPALDIGAAAGAAVLAPGDAVVLRAGRNGALGNAIVLSHGFGITTRYAHLSNIEVVAGDRVRRGDRIGRVGRSGRATDYHLHYQVFVDRQPVNPFEYILDH